jgi:hypothetical protein
MFSESTEQDGCGEMSAMGVMIAFFLIRYLITRADGDYSYAR